MFDLPDIAIPEKAGSKNRYCRESELRVRHSRESGNPSAADQLPVVVASKDR
jgi:hypothetical protein